MTETNLNTTVIFHSFTFEVKISLKFMHGSLEIHTCTHIHTITLKTTDSMDLLLPPLMSVERVCTYLSKKAHQL